MVSGDFEKAGSLLEDDFKIRNGVGTNKDFKGWSKTQFINNMEWWHDNFDYFSIEKDLPAYPDGSNISKTIRLGYKHGKEFMPSTKITV